MQIQNLCDDTLRHVSTFLGALQSRILLFGFDRDIRGRMLNLQPPVFVRHAHPWVGVVLSSREPKAPAPDDDRADRADSPLTLTAFHWSVWPDTNIMIADYAGVCPHDGCGRMLIVIPESTRAHFQIVCVKTYIVRAQLVIASGRHVADAATYEVTDDPTAYVPMAGDRIQLSLHMIDLVTLPRSSFSRRPPAVGMRVWCS